MHRKTYRTNFDAIDSILQLQKGLHPSILSALLEKHEDCGKLHLDRSFTKERNFCMAKQSTLCSQKLKKNFSFNYLDFLQRKQNSLKQN